jgi:hypothetical protein
MDARPPAYHCLFAVTIGAFLAIASDANAEA